MQQYLPKNHPLDLSVVIPCFNEELCIQKTIQSVAQYFTEKNLAGEIIAVDDGSTDSTIAILTEISRPLPLLRIIALGKNHGKGRAVQKGVLSAKGKIILFMDADSSTPITELNTLRQALDNGTDIAIGSRYLPASTITAPQSRYRVILGRIGNRIIQTLLLKNITDTQCGFKAFPYAIAQDIFSRQTITRWGFDIEILTIAQQSGYTIKEVPISWNNTSGRTSRLRPIKDALRTLRDLVYIKMRCVRGKYVMK